MTTTARQSVTKFIAELHHQHIPVEQTYLFGSAARNEQHEWSDIDLAIIGPSFAKDYFEELLQLHRIAQTIDPALSPVPLRPADLLDRFSPIADAIRRDGQEVIL